MEAIKPNTKVDLNILLQQVAPEGFRIVTEDDFQQLQKMKQEQVKPAYWTLKEFAWHEWHQRGVKRATDFLFDHRDDLDMMNGGFIDYDHTHNGWKIPAVQITNYLRELQGGEKNDL